MRGALRGAAAFIRLARPQNAILPGIAVIAGFIVSGASNQRALAVSIITTILFIWLVTIWNDIADEESDRLNGITRIAAVRRMHAYPALLVCMTAAAIAAAAISLALPLSTRALLYLYPLLGWLYNSNPARVSRRPILSIAILAAAYSLVPFMAGVSLGVFSWPALLLAICWTLVRVSISLLKDYKDAVGDVKAEKKTFLLVYGNTLTVQLSFAFACIGYCGCVFIGAYKARYAWLAGITLAAIALWLLIERAQLFTRHNYAALNRVFHKCLEYEIIFDCAVIAWLYTR